ncbi:signal peptidase II [Mangrovimonas sp. YM274]|uniref:signal peptidase II n=1 Tax=Mangrovimonas sp. YM274 TaxID=3070660 RepID=UPI0027DE9DD8|nr:signal peptidase II [Mangrovimonas sp. YM274]WMI69503.1 signal peptidase II [Mangrovimonas sp. YM274]
MKISRSLGIVLLIAANIAVDQISKVIIRQSVDPREQISLIGDVFVMMNVENTGAFLGMGSDLNPTLKLIFLLLLPVLVLGYLIYYIFKTKTLDRFSLVALCCIAGGGIANVYDRIVYGSVTDFLHLDFGGMFKTGIFNIADVSVSTGMIMLLVANFFNKKKA